MMRLLTVLMLIVSNPLYSASVGVRGHLKSSKSCSEKAMIWLSLDKVDYKDRLLLMHTEVPKGGSFQFYLKPGDYQIRASDKMGCEFFDKIKIKDSVSEIIVEMRKK